MHGWGTVHVTHGIIMEDRTHISVTPFTEDFTTYVVDQLGQIVEEAKNYVTYKLGVATHEYGLPVIVVIGIIGNILSLAVMAQKKNRDHPSCVYLSGLAINDVGSLLLSAVYWLSTVALINIPQTYAMHVWLCKIGNYLQHIFTLAAVLTTLAMTTDRLIAARFPFRYRAVCTARRAWFVLIGIWIAVVLYYIPLVYSSDVIYLVGSAVCNSYVHTNVALLIHMWINTFLNSFLIFMAILIINVITIHAIRSSGKKLKKMSGNDTKMTMEDEPTTSRDEAPVESLDNLKQPRDRNGQIDGKKQPRNSHGQNDGMKQLGARDRQITRMLILVSFVFLILTGPRWIEQLVYIYVDKYSSPRAFADYIFAQHFTQKLERINSAINFFLYCISGSKFRKDLREMFRQN